MQSESSTVFTDVAADGIKTLYKTEAIKRSEEVLDVSYRLAYALLRGGEHFQGYIEVKFSLTDASATSDDIFLDYRGKELQSLVINGQQVTKGTPFHDHRIYLPKEHLQAGVNNVNIRFVSAYVKDCAGVQYFKDKDDGEEYLYSDHEPASAHKGFPCFDQPDMKATYQFLALAPKEWSVFANAPQVKDTSFNGSEEFSAQLKSFNVDEKEFTSHFNDEAIACFEFGESPRISTYLYCFIAGPYVCMESDRDEIKNFKVPLRIMSRKSIAKYAEKAKEEYFNVTKSGIQFYEEFFTREYPFAKLDQAFVPDYSMGAMENVGLVVYRDQYIQRDELFSEKQRQGIFNTFLHEISHMWFGNLVTMKWWDDLWLNESFANFVSYVCQDEAVGLEHCHGSWKLFLDESFWGLGVDQKNTTHPISVDVIHTESATDIFDGISYGKGASWLNQTFHFFGREVLKAGLASYFKEYSFKNTSLDDFIKHLSEAAVKCGVDRDFKAWSHSWLKSAGCNIIWHDVVEEDGKIKKFTVQQRVHKYGEGNQLRVQKYKCAFYDSNMKVTKVVDIITKDDQETFDIAELEGQEAPFAYHINYLNHGYAKFKIDDKSIKVFEEHLGKIDDSMSRKQIYNIFYDMLQDQEIAGAWLLKICKSQLQNETDADVIADSFRSTIPAVIKKHIPLEAYAQSHHDIFELILDGILTNGGINDNATRHLVLTSLLSSCRNEEDSLLLVQWFKDGFITNSSGKKLEDVEVSLKHKHAIVQRIWAAEKIPLEQKQEVLAELTKMDKSDWLDDTNKLCESSHPANKEKMWKLYFSTDPDSELKDWGLYSYHNSFRGWNQVQHRESTEKFEDEFFEKIADIIKTKGRYVAEAYYYLLQPTNKTDAAAIKRFQDLLDKTLKDDKDNTFFINLLKDSISGLETQQKGQALSREYLASEKS